MRGAIFDADGTLLDSMPLWDNIGRDYLLSLGITPEPKVDEVIMTMSFASSCQYFIDRYGVNKTVAEIIGEISLMVADKYRNRVPLKAGAGEYIKRLKANGVKICVVTASERGYITECFKRLAIYDSLDFIMTCGEEGLDKNNCLIYDRAADRLGVDKESITVFEDAFNAVEAAAEGGYRVCAVYDKSMEKYADRIKKTCHKYIYSFDDLSN